MNLDRHKLRSERMELLFRSIPKDLFQRVVEFCLTADEREHLHHDTACQKRQAASSKVNKVARNVMWAQKLKCRLEALKTSNPELEEGFQEKLPCCRSDLRSAHKAKIDAYEADLAKTLDALNGFPLEGS